MKLNYVMSPKKLNKKPSKKMDDLLNHLSNSLEASTTLRNRTIEDNTMASESELSVLIRSIIREEVGAAFDKLQPQLDAMKIGLSTCTQKLTEVEQGLLCIDGHVTKLETTNERLLRENKELKDKLERLETHSTKFNLRVFGLNCDTEKGNSTAFMTAFSKEVFQKD